MNRFATSLISKPVLLQSEKAVVGFVEDLVVNPDTGQLVGILLKESFGKGVRKAIAMKDVLGIADQFFLVASYSVLGEPKDIVRIEKLLERKISIIDNKVYTVSGKFLGKVYDYILNLETSYLAKIYVKPPLLFSLANHLIIDFSQIISIEKDKITVADSLIPAKKAIKIVKHQPEVAP